MSFSSEAKAELCLCKTESKQSAVAECYGILLYCNTFSPQEIRIITASSEFASLLPRLFRKAFGTGFDAVPPDDAAGKRTFRITDPQKISRIYSAFDLDRDSTAVHHVNLGVLDEDNCRTAFVRGAFLAGGSVTDPQKRNHLELGTQHLSVSREVYALLLDMGFSPKETARGSSSLLYFKKSDMISDFLSALGATNAAMAVITAKIEKEVNNNLNRQVNCAFSNADKTVDAAQAQVDAIKYIMRKYSLDSLPDTLRDAALLRIANPAATLSDLSLLSYPHVTRSCLAYRLRRILEIVEHDKEN